MNIWNWYLVHLLVFVIGLICFLIFRYSLKTFRYFFNSGWSIRNDIAEFSSIHVILTTMRISIWKCILQLACLRILWQLKCKEVKEQNSKLLLTTIPIARVKLNERRGKQEADDDTCDRKYRRKWRVVWETIGDCSFCWRTWNEGYFERREIFLSFKDLNACSKLKMLIDGLVFSPKLVEMRQYRAFLSQTN